MKKYIVVDQIGNDDYADVFDTIEAANDFALKSWKHLTNYEKKGRHIYVCEVTEKDLDDWAVDEETGEIDWRCFFQSNLPADGFDSAKYEEQLAREEEERFREEQREWDEWEKSVDEHEENTAPKFPYPQSRMKIMTVAEYLESHPDVKTETRISKKGDEFIKIYAEDIHPKEFRLKYIKYDTLAVDYLDYGDGNGEENGK